MAKGRPSFERRAREKARKEKADAKRARRHARPSEEDEAEAAAATPSGPPPGAERSNAAVQDQLATLHKRYDDGQLSLDDFTEQRELLLSQLHID